MGEKEARHGGDIAEILRPVVRRWRDIGEIWARYRPDLEACLEALAEAVPEGARDPEALCVVPTSSREALRRVSVRDRARGTGSTGWPLTLTLALALALTLTLALTGSTGWRGERRRPQAEPA